MIKGVVIYGEVNQGESTDKGTGEVFSWDKVELTVLVMPESPRELNKRIFGKGKPREFSIKNDFKEFVFANGFPVTAWNDLDGCGVEIYLTENNKFDCLKVISIDGTV